MHIMHRFGCDENKVIQPGVINPYELCASISSAEWSFLKINEKCGHEKHQYWSACDDFEVVEDLPSTSTAVQFMGMFRFSQTRLFFQHVTTICLLVALSRDRIYLLLCYPWIITLLNDDRIKRSPKVRLNNLQPSLGHVLVGWSFSYSSV